LGLNEDLRSAGCESGPLQREEVAEIPAVVDRP